MLADGYRGALVGPDGDVSWLCAPSWEDPAVFSNLLGGYGRYLVTPATPRYVWGGYYEPESLIWVSRWVTTDGIIESREALAYPGEERRLVLLRRVHALDRPAVVRVLLDPRADFGREPVQDVRRDDAGAIWLARTGRLHLRYLGGHCFERGEDAFLFGELHIPAGQHHDLVLEISTEPLDDPPPHVEGAWRATEHAWRSASPPLPGCVARRDALFAHAVLRGMTRPGGGMVAAATTALPERAQASRDYDYRYAWIRDQCYAGQAAAAAGAYDLLDDVVAFITERVLADGGRLAPAYTVTGLAVPPQKRFEALPGYPGAKVRIGNWVRRQFQLDVFGEVLLLLSTAGRHARLDSASWRALQITAEAIAQRWREPDAGIWELGDRHWTHSKLVCVAGLRAAARVTSSGQGARWMALSDAILTHVGEHGMHPSGRWQRAYDDERVDAALLLPAIRGALAPDDPRTVATRHAALSELGRDGYLFRFRPDRRPLGDAEGAFLFCGFTAALALHQAGDVGAANRWFERNRAACGSPGLYTEEYDVLQRQLRGNLPQAFVHALMLETAAVLGGHQPGGEGGCTTGGVTRGRRRDEGILGV